MAKIDLRNGDYLKGADIEARMWRCYYNHNFVGLIWNLLRFMRNVFQCGWLLAAGLAWHAGVAAAIYRLQKGHENYPGVLKSLIKFYKLDSDHALEPFDYEKAARLELEWWDIHRYPEKHQKTLEQSLAEAAAIPYNCDPARLKEYAIYRAKAAKMLTHEGDKYVIKNDWPKIEDLLHKTWSSFNQAVSRKG